MKLEIQDQRYLDAAQGWLGLGNWHEANEELERIRPELRAHPDVLLARCEVYMKAEKWDWLITVTQTLVNVAPEKPRGWILRSYGLHKLKRTEEAFYLLLPVGERFSKEWVIPYNLACDCAQLGPFDQGREWFKKALAIDEKSARAGAIFDPDLEPLLDSMSRHILGTGDRLKMPPQTSNSIKPPRNPYTKQLVDVSITRILGGAVVVLQYYELPCIGLSLARELRALDKRNPAAISHKNPGNRVNGMNAAQTKSPATVTR
jgi:tetratricopeptide (TPR) repeat protein